MANMYLLCGISGSGKTTLSIDFAARNNLLRLGIDDFYAKVNGDECDRRNTFDAWIEYFKAIHEAEVNDVDCVVDTNALTWHQRMQFIEWFPTFKHHIIYIDADYDLQKSNNESRRRQVPDHRMEKMKNELQVPTHGLDYCWDSIVHVRNVNNCFVDAEVVFGEFPLIKTLLKNSR